MKLDSLCKIGKSYFIYKFLNGLILRFEIFPATFNQTHKLILFVARDKIKVIITVTFDKAVIVAEKQKQ